MSCVKSHRDLEKLKRKKQQSIAKKHNIKANLSSHEIIKKLSSHVLIKTIEQPNVDDDYNYQQPSKQRRIYRRIRNKTHHKCNNNQPQSAAHKVLCQKDYLRTICLYLNMKDILGAIIPL